MLLPFALPLTLALAPVATDVAVYPPSVFPAAGAALPANARLVVFPGSEGTEDAAFLLRRGDQSLETLTGVDVDTLAVGGFSERTAVVLSLPALEVDEAVTFEPSCSSCNDVHAFTAGDTIDVEAPVFGGSAAEVAVSASRAGPTRPASAWIIAVDLPALVRTEPFFVRVAGDVVGIGETFVRGNVDERGFVFSLGNDLGEHPEGSEVCFDVFAVDVAGNEGAALPVCVELVDEQQPWGCAQGASGNIGLLGLALLLVRRR